MKKNVSLVIPLHNEEANIRILLAAIHQVFLGLPYNYTVLLIDDGSKDGSMRVVREMAAADDRINFISFSRNFGHQSALKAGYDHAKGECVISLDADMQHPPSLIPEMLQRWEEGYDVVYTIRGEEAQISPFKKRSSRQFYRLLNRISDVEIEEGTPDFRLVSRPVLNVLKDLNEYDLFFRGLIKWIGFKQIGIIYQQQKRVHGASKYTFKKMASFALQGITSFSIRPLYAAAYLGFIISLFSILYVPYVMFSYFTGNAISGWSSVLVTIAFFGGLQLMILGIIGVYLGKLFMQAKQRPQYIIQEHLLHETP